MKVKNSLIVMLLAIGGYAAAQSNEHAQHHPKPEAHAKPAPAMGMDMAACMRDMKAAEARLSALVAKMNATQGIERYDATTAVVNELAAEQKQMMAMCRAMMSHMDMGHGMMMGGMKPPAKHQHSKPAGKDHAGHHQH